MSPPDPEAEAKRANAVRIISALVEERARLGLPPVFGKPTPKILEITDSGNAVPPRRDISPLSQSRRRV
jgi:hypothetical protein